MLVQQIAPDVALQRRQPVRGAVVRRGARHGRGDGGVRLSDVAEGDPRLLVAPAPQPQRFTSWRAGEPPPRRRRRSTTGTTTARSSRKTTPELAPARHGSRGASSRTAASSGRLAARTALVRPVRCRRRRAAQIVAWQGLRRWDASGGHRPREPQRARTIAPARPRARPALRREARRLHGRSLFLPASLDRPARPYRPADRDAEGSYWNLVDPVRARLRVLPAGHRRGARHHALPARCTARACSACRAPTRTSSTAHNTVGTGLGADLRAQHVSLPRRQRRARPARAQPLRDARDRDDAGHLRLGRGDLGAPGRTRVLPQDVHAAELRRERASWRRCGCCWSTSGAGARRAARARPRVLDPACLARRRQGRSSVAARRRASGRFRTRSPGRARRSRFTWRCLRASRRCGFGSGCPRVTRLPRCRRVRRPSGSRRTARSTSPPLGSSIDLRATIASSSPPPPPPTPVSPPA